MEAFETLNVKLASAPILALARIDGKILVDTVVCDRQVECVLLQAQPDKSVRPSATGLAR